MCNADGDIISDVHAAAVKAGCLPDQATGMIREILSARIVFRRAASCSCSDSHDSGV